MQTKKNARSLLIGLVAFAAVAQTAQQGDSKKNPGGYEEFHSPMILNTVFAAADRSLWKTEWFSNEEYWKLRRLRCEKISILTLEMSAKELPGGWAEVKVRIGLRNPDQNHDKKVTLLLEAMNGEDVVSTLTLDPVKVEEGAVVRKTVKTILPMAALKTDPMTKLRMTMTTWDY